MYGLVCIFLFSFFLAQPLFFSFLFSMIPGTSTAGDGVFFSGFLDCIFWGVWHVLPVVTVGLFFGDTPPCLPAYLFILFVCRRWRLFFMGGGGEAVLLAWWLENTWLFLFIKVDGEGFGWGDVNVEVWFNTHKGVRVLNGFCLDNFLCHVRGCYLLSSPSVTRSALSLPPSAGPPHRNHISPPPPPPAMLSSKCYSVT